MENFYPVALFGVLSTIVVFVSAVLLDMFAHLEIPLIAIIPLIAVATIYYASWRAARKKAKSSRHGMLVR